jgi:SAM-dependent methyltransferase
VSSWEWQADRWLAWARTPGHDSYWLFRDSFFDAIVPAPGRLTLEVGCGEGRVARDLARLGHTVIALDASPTLVATAAAADPAGRYLVADAAALPLGDESLDLVVTYNSLMDVADMPAAVQERTPASWPAPDRAPSRTPSPAAALTARLGYERWQRLPNFLHLRAVKLS